MAEAEYLSWKDQYAMALAAEVHDAPAKLTEKAKEAKALAENKALVEIRKHMSQALEALIEIKGERDAYKAAYEMVSRLVTVHQMQWEMSRGR